MTGDTAGPPRILPMQPADIEPVLTIERQVHDRPWSHALFTAELAAPGRRYLTAWSGAGAPRRLLGYGGVLLAVDEAHVTNVAVGPDDRRRKVASHLVIALLDAAMEMGAVAATLEVGAGNSAAQRLYSAFGFIPVGVRPRYYAATGEDAIIMWVHDLAGPASTARLDRLCAQMQTAQRPPSARVAATPAEDRQAVG